MCSCNSNCPATMVAKPTSVIMRTSGPALRLACGPPARPALARSRADRAAGCASIVKPLQFLRQLGSCVGNGHLIHGCGPPHGQSNERLLPPGAAQLGCRAGPPYCCRARWAGPAARTTSTSSRPRWSRAAARLPASPSRARSCSATATLSPADRLAFIKFLARTMQPDADKVTRAAKAFLDGSSTASDQGPAAGRGKSAAGVLPPPESGARRHR